MTSVRTEASQILTQLGLPAASVPNLPPEVRDELLTFVQRWGSPTEQLELVAAVREVHGPLLFLLDYQALALYRLGRYTEALDVVERRQRRSTSVTTQMREAITLLAAGQQQPARSLATELARTYPRHTGAVCTAAEILITLGDYAAAEAVLRTLLDYRPADLQGNLTHILLTRHAQGNAAADEQMQRLGTGIPAGISDEDLQRLELLAEEMGRRETAAAVSLELERRRLQEYEQLRTHLKPFLTESDELAKDPELFYRLHNGPEAVPVSREERTRIEVETIRHFGFSRLRLGQVETMAAVLRGESTLTVMPTGAGKSLCYQLPALIFPRATLVISPLIALMKDQVEGLPTVTRKRATFINSVLSEAELAARMAAVARGEYKLIYAAPERLRQRAFLRALRQTGLDLFVVDEAHCVSMWGHDFRPDYLFIEEARRELGNPPALAMTATAPPRVRDEIVEYITNEHDREPRLTDIDRPRVISLDIYRPNLHLSAVQFHNEEEKLEALLEFVSKATGSGIVYVNSRHKAEMLALSLRNAGVKAEAYHAGLENRGPVQDRFMNDTTRVVVATIAFGMGIDKSDIRFIVHFHPSRSLDAYYQEVGRAGRDGVLSQGVLFYSNNDWANLRRWAKADEYNVEFLEKVYAAIATQLNVTPPAADAAAPVTLDTSVAGPVDARRLQQVLNSDETAVRVAISLLERADLLTRGFDVPLELTLMIPRRIPKEAQTDKGFQRLLKGLALGPEQSATFGVTDIARFMHWLPYDVEGYLLDWAQLGWLTLRGGKRAMYIELPPSPPDPRERLDRLLSHSAAVAQRRIDDMIGYATTESCRHGYISAHFGSPPRVRCPVCDNCTGVRPDIKAPQRVAHVLPDDADIEPMVIDCLISLPRPVGRSGLVRILAGGLRAAAGPDKARHFGALKGLGESSIAEYIDDMLEDGRLRQYERNGYLVLAPTIRGRAEAEAWLAEHPELNFYQAADPNAVSDKEAEPAEAEKYTGLQKALWLWRRRVAEELGQPAYVVMSNEVMLRIAEVRPQTLADLGELPGIGGQRLQHYGAAILDIVKLHPAQDGDVVLLTTQRQAMTEATADAKAAAGQIRKAVEGHSPQIERQILMRLQEVRQKRAVAERAKPYAIAPDSLLREIARRAPLSTAELMAIPGFRSSGLATEVNQILTMIHALRQIKEE